MGTQDTPYQLLGEPNGVLEDIRLPANGESRSWIQTVLGNSEEALRSAIDEAAETHRMLIRMKGILAITKHRMNKKRSNKADNRLARLCLICEKQVTMMAHLHSLLLDRVKEEENLFGRTMEYIELWSKDRRGHASLYERQKAASLYADIYASGDNALSVAREAQIAAAVQQLKKVAVEFKLEGQALESSGSHRLSQGGLA